MTNPKRMEELLTSIQAFNKPTYLKKELLDEMLLLQREIVSLTFNDTHASGAELRLWNVVKHFEQLNEQCGHVADDEMIKFKNDCYEVNNLIRGQISGNYGENKVFWKLDGLHIPNIVLKNVELGDIGNHTELDAVVITQKGITIVEVKNTSKNIFIDENGGYYRMGEYQNFDCDIKKKMDFRAELLKNILENNGIENVKIREQIVFTNSSIEIHNKCSEIKTCFLNQLTSKIEDTVAGDIYSVEDMEKIKAIIEENESQGAFYPDFDVQMFKVDFAKLMATLEVASQEREYVQEMQSQIAQSENIIEQKTEESKHNKPNLNCDIIMKYAGIAATLFIPVISTIVVTNKIVKGGFVK